LMSANYYCVSKLILVTANYYWCHQTSVGVSKLLLVSPNFCWCQQNYYWCQQTSVGVSKFFRFHILVPVSPHQQTPTNADITPPLY